jgi:hypothetical protein
MKTTITTNALIKRINRKLAHGDEKLRVTRGERCRPELGDYHAINVSHNFITAKHVEPEAWGRELEVLQPFEQLAD